MRILPIIYLIVGVAGAVDFVTTFIQPQVVYAILFWDTNVWVYRVYKIAVVFLFAKLLFDEWRAQKLRSE